MKAVVCTALGGPEVLKEMEWPSRAPGPGEVRVAMNGGGINFADLLVISGQYQEEWNPPFVLGTEGAGTVQECAPDVTAFKPGDRVLVQNNAGRACYAEEITVSWQRLAPVPDEVPLNRIIGLPINYGTAYYAIVTRGQVRAGEVVVVHGAAGGVGLAAVQIAKTLGATVIATGGSDEKLALVKAEGADHTVNYRTEVMHERVLALTGGRGADVYYDPVGGDVFDNSMKAIAMGGRILVIGFTSGRIPKAAANRVLFKGISIVGAPYGKFSKSDHAGWSRTIATLLDMVRTGAVRPRIHQYFPLAEASAALSLVRDRAVVGKCVLLTERGFAELALTPDPLPLKR